MSRNEQLAASVACERVPRNTVDMFSGSEDK